MQLDDIDRFFTSLLTPIADSIDNLGACENRLGADTPCSLSESPASARSMSLPPTPPSNADLDIPLPCYISDRGVTWDDFSPTSVDQPNLYLQGIKAGAMMAPPPSVDNVIWFEPTEEWTPMFQPLDPLSWLSIPPLTDQPSHEVTSPISELYCGVTSSCFTPLQWHNGSATDGIDASVCPSMLLPVSLS